MKNTLSQGNFDSSDSIKNNKVLLISSILLTVFIIAVAYHYINGYYFRSGYPLNTFLFRPPVRFSDYFQVYDITKQFNNSQSGFIAYFPFTHLILSILTLLPAKVGFLFMSLSFLCMLFLQMRFFVVDKIPTKILRYQTALVLSLLTYPTLFALDRGNIEIIIYIFLGFFFYFYYVKKSKWLSILFLGAAIGMKMIAAVFLILLISDKKYRELLYVFLTTVFFTLSGYASMIITTGKSVAQIIRAAQDSTNLYFFNYVLEWQGLTHSHSLWNFFKIYKLIWNLDSDSQYALNIYTLVILAIIGLVVLYIIFIEQEDWKKITLLVLSMILFPYASGDYTLIYIYFPLTFFIMAKKQTRNELFYLFTFSFLLLPINYFYFDFPISKFPYLHGDISYAVIIYPLAMALLMSKIVYDGLYSRFGRYSLFSLKAKKSTSN